MQPPGSDASKDASQSQFSDAPGCSTMELLTAAAQGNESLVRTLMQQGADPLYQASCLLASTISTFLPLLKIHF